MTIDDKNIFVQYLLETALARHSDPWPELSGSLRYQDIETSQSEGGPEELTNERPQIVWRVPGTQSSTLSTEMQHNAMFTRRVLEWYIIAASEQNTFQRRFQKVLLNLFCDHLSTEVECEICTMEYKWIEFKCVFPRNKSSSCLLNKNLLLY